MRIWPKRIGVLVLLTFSTSLLAADWPCWRGPDHNGISQETGWKSEFEGEALWKGSVGIGFSSMAVSQGRVFTMGNKDETDFVYCLDALTGKEIWTKSYASELKPNMYDGGPSATPTVDGERVYTHSKQGLLFCLDAKTGDVVWLRDIGKEFEYEIPQWGLASSVLIVDSMAVVNVGLTGIAFDKKTGKTIWQGDKGQAGYSSPVRFTKKGRDCLAMFNGKSLAIVESKTGKLVGQHPWKTSWDINAADPIVLGETLLVSSGYGSGSALLNIAGDEPVEIWKQKKLKSQLNAPVLWEGHLYGISGNVKKKADLVCVDFATGDVKWSQKGFKAGSLFVADGKLVILNDGGELIVAEAKPDKYVEISRAKILEGRCWTVPVLANGLLYARNAVGDLVCLDLRNKK